MPRILVLNGPNLDRLGTREPDIYGAATLPEIMTGLEQLATGLGHALSSFQSNAEPELIEMIRQAEREEIDFILINPAAWTHTSVALRDALAGSGIPFIELHISNVFAREPFRHKSFFSDLAVGVITGFGPQSYELALSAADRWLNERRP